MNEAVGRDRARAFDAGCLGVAPYVAASADDELHRVSIEPWENAWSRCVY